MKCVWQRSAKVLVGLIVGAMYAMPQAYTISARPGAVNYIEGNAYVNGHAISEKGLKGTFLNANDTLSTDTGKAEVLLTPGVFLRIGDNSEVRMISPSLTDIQVEVKRGEAMIEVAGLMKDNNVQIINHGGSIMLEKDGLYRISGDNPPTAAVLEGKADVHFGDRKVELGKGRETVISDNLKTAKFDTKREDDLYAWSNVRSEYDAAASYQVAKNVAANSYGAGWNGYGYGYGGFYGGPGWYWDNGFNSWAWLAGGGAFYSPFGWGFYGPGYVGYAPIVVAPVYGGGTWRRGHWNGNGKKGTTVTVPVNPQHPPAVGTIAASPFANRAARVQAAHSFAATGGFHTVNGGNVPVGRASGPSVGRTGGASAGSAGRSSGWSGGAARSASGGGFSGGGGAHVGGGGAPSGGGGSHK